MDKQLFVISDKDGHSERRGINKHGWNDDGSTPGEALRWNRI